ncbi:hypothetical protein KJ966_16235 [bacterium]|nr:hypothetical protein [bacterium]
MEYPGKRHLPVRIFCGVFFISSSALMFEVALSRLLAITLWHHFAFLIISCALLGYGAAGSWLFLFGKPSKPFLPALLYSILLLPIFMAANRCPFDPALMTLYPLHLLYLILIFLLLSIPFFFSGLVISGLLQQHPDRSFPLYCFDLLGAATGTIFFFAVAAESREMTWLIFVMMLAAISCVLLSPDWKKGVIAITCPLMVVGVLSQTGLLDLKISDYKSLSLAMKNPGARHIQSESDAISRIDWFKSPLARFAPGLSLNYQGALPDQIGITIDGGKLSAYSAWNSRDREFYRHLPTDLILNLDTPVSNILILQVIGGQDLQAAINSGVSQIKVQTDNAIIGNWLEKETKTPGVTVISQKARTFLAMDRDKYDRIIVSLEGALPTGGTGISSLDENTLITVEGVISLFEHMDENGWISFHYYLIPPPRAEFRLMATLVEVLNMQGKDPGNHLGAFRTVSTIMIVISSKPWGEAHKSRFRAFCDQMGYTPVYYPGMERKEANRNNRFARPIYADTLEEILNSPQQLYEKSIFRLKPATDDKPYFNHFLKLSKIRETYYIFDKKWEALIEGGLLLPAIFYVVFLLAGVMILVPYRSKRKSAIPLGFETIYFLSLGFGFMMVEIVYLEFLTRFLGSPTYSFAFVLATLLLTTGCGAMVFEGLTDRARKLSHLILIIILVSYSFLFGRMIAVFAGESFAVRILVTSILIGIPGVLMGFLFPRGIEKLGRNESSKGQIPMAWCLNSFASVIGSIAAMILAIYDGLSNLFLWAAVCYSFAWISFKRY